MAEIFDLSGTAASNTARFPENMQFRNVNDSARELEAMIARNALDHNGSVTSGGSANAYTVTPNRTIASYSDKLTMVFTANHSNSGAPTLNISSLGAKAIVGPSGAALISGDIVSGAIVSVVYDLANDWFQLLSQRAATPVASGTSSKVGDVVLTLDTTVRAGRIRLGESTQTFDPVAYPELSAWLVGNSSPWGANTLPSAAGYFLRFAATTSSVDTSGARTAGSTQADQNKAHTHGPGTLAGTTSTNGAHTHLYGNAGNNIAGGSGNSVNDASYGGSFSTSSAGSHSHTVSITSGTTASDGSDEARVKNVAMHADIIASATTSNADIYAVNGLAMTFDTGTAAADPGAGRLRFNNATLASATAFYISETGYFGEDIADLLGTWDDSTSTVKGTLKIYKVGAPANFAAYSLTGSMTDSGAYRSGSLTYVDGAGTFANGDPIGVQFTRTGDKGEQGAAGGGISWTWDTSTTDADPGTGDIRANNATTASITEFYVSTTDADAVDETDWLDSLDDSTNTIKGTLQLVKSSNPSVFSVFQVTGVTTASGYRKIAVTYVSGPGGFSAADGITLVFSRSGDVGPTGTTGDAGTNGADGTDPGFLYTFSTTTTDADPGAGVLRANNADLSSATALYIDDSDRNGNGHEATILGWDDVSNATLRGQLLISRPSDGAQVVYNITGASTDNSGYVALAVTYSSGATSFADAAPISVQFIPSGNDGAGAVDSVYGRTGAVVAANSDYDITQVDFSATDRIAGRITAGAGLAEELTAAQVRTLINVADGATANTGDLVASNNLSDVDNAGTVRTNLGLAIGSDVEAYDADTLKADTADVLTAGFAGTPHNAGTKTTGTFTPDEASGNLQYAVNGGAHTLAPPTNNCSIVLQYTNDGSAGTITTSGFTKVNGDSLTTVNGDDFMLFITKNNSLSVLTVVALQ